jgi:hypothetical protein
MNSPFHIKIKLYVPTFKNEINCINWYKFLYSLPQFLKKSSKHPRKQFIITYYRKHLRGSKENGAVTFSSNSYTFIM